MRLLVLFVLFTLLAGNVLSQNWQSLNDDDLYNQARSTAIDGNHDLARQMVDTLLRRTPQHWDAHILLGRICLWSKDYVCARENVNKVLQQDAASFDGLALLAAIDIQQRNYDEALTSITKALTIVSIDEDLLFKKGTALHALQRDDEALIVLQQLITLNPSHSHAAGLMNEISQRRKKWNIGIQQSIDFFSRIFNPAHYTSLQMSTVRGWGSLTVRANYANRFNIDGLQGEIESYPKIAKGFYGYLNYGYSNSVLFPQHRGGAELFARLPYHLEGSVGLRYLHFTNSGNVTSYTASLGLYAGNYWLSLRGFVTPSDETETTGAGIFNIRRYFNNPDTYLNLLGSVGFSPDINRIQSGAGLTTDVIYILRAQRLGMMGQKLMSKDFILSGGFEVTRQELIFETGTYMNILTVSAGVKKKF